MRLPIPLLVTSSSLVDATWVILPGHRDLVGRGSSPQPRETGCPSRFGTTGWTPKPTRAPGSQPESDVVLELLKEKRATTGSYSWEDDKTCGWTSGVSSEPFTCQPQYSCRTNAADVVACVSGTYSPFFTVCLDMQAFEQGACASIGTQTGCCQSSGFGACGTFLWTGTPARSMYRCFPRPTIISMNDEPQAVIDAAARTTAAASSSIPTSSTSGAATAAADGDDDDDHHSTHIGAIVGGVVGGIAGIALITGLAAWLILRRSRTGENHQTYNAVLSDTSNPHNQPQQMAQQFPGGYHTVPGGGGPTTFPPTSPYPTSVSTATAHDPRQSYYDPSRSPGQVSQTIHTPPAQQHFFTNQPHGPTSPPLPVEVAAPYHPRHSTMSELDSGAMSGASGNPVEIGEK